MNKAIGGPGSGGRFGGGSGGASGASGGGGGASVGGGGSGRAGGGASGVSGWSGGGGGGYHQKDFGRQVSAAAAAAELQSALPATITNPAADSTVREVFAFLLVEGLSYELQNAFCRLAEQIDEVTGKAVRVRVIGDPELSGSTFIANLTEEDRVRLKQDGERYVQEFVRTCREQHHVVGQNRKLCELLGRNTAELPCLDFRVPGAFESVGLLPIKIDWVRGEETRSIVCEELLAWFRAGTLAAWLEKAIDPDILRLQLMSALRDLSGAIDSAVGSKAAGDAATVSVSIPCRPGDGWSQVMIHLQGDGERVSIRTALESRVVNFTQLGMIDRRNATPNEQWELFRAILDNGGTLTWSDSEADPRNQKRKERLAARLREIFGISADPFESIDHGWKARFQVPPPGSE